MTMQTMTTQTMQPETKSTVIEVMGKKYHLKCQESEIKPLQQAAQYLENKMREVREATNVLSMDRLAVITALQVTYQFLNLEQEQSVNLQQLQQRLCDLHSTIDCALAQHAQMELQSAD